VAFDSRLYVGPHHAERTPICSTMSACSAMLSFSVSLLPGLSAGLSAQQRDQVWAHRQMVQRGSKRRPILPQRRLPIPHAGRVNIGDWATRQTSITAWMQVPRTAGSCGWDRADRNDTYLLGHMIYCRGKTRRELAAYGLPPSYGSHHIGPEVKRSAEARPWRGRLLTPAEIAELLRDDRTYRIAPTSGAGGRSGRDCPI
jgi:hypothetical protein